MNKLRKYIPLIVTPLTVRATLWLWVISGTGIVVMWFTNDGYNNVRTGPPYPLPTPNPYPPTVYPNILPAATPIPGTGQPPAIEVIKYTLDGRTYKVEKGSRWVVCEPRF